MEETGIEDDFLKLRVKQLERERDDLRRNIERLCLQQTGQSYLSSATQMHHERTTGLEEEIESLKKKLISCTRDNKNLQEQLSESYRIKAQLADLHAAEVSKNTESDKQIKFFQSCVASAFAERDSSLIEAEKAKEQWESLSEKLEGFENRLQEAESNYKEEKKLNSILHGEVEKLKEDVKILTEVATKFSEIRESSSGCSNRSTLQEKCSALLNDPSELWIFDFERNHGSYIASLEDQVVTLRESIDGLQKKMKMGMDIEQYLRRRVRNLEKNQANTEKKFRRDLSTLRKFVDHQRSSIMTILDDESVTIKSTVDLLHEKIRVLSIENYADSRISPEHVKGENSGEETGDMASIHSTITEENPVDSFKEDVARAKKELLFLNESGDPIEREYSSSDVLAQAMKEKVEALLLLSQEEERHLLERDLNSALEKRITDLQRSLTQVTNEKVQALLDLAQMKQEYQNLLRSRGIVVHDKNERLRNLLKKTYLRRWVGRDGGSDESQPSSQQNHLALDSARLKSENAAFRESMVNIDQLSSSVGKLRFSLLKVKEEARSGVPAEDLAAALEAIRGQAEVIRDSLKSTLPLSWSGGTDDTSATDDVDFATTVGPEMMELLVLAVELVRESVYPKMSSST